MIAYILAVLAAYRIARMLATEEGPESIFEHIRNRFDPLQATWIGRGLNCPFCVGFWISLVMACLLPFYSWQIFLLTWWGIAGAQTLLQLWGEQWTQ